VGALLNELAGALADSGPSELGVLPELWLDALAAADRGVASLGGGSSAETQRQTKRSIRELQLFFSRRLTWPRAIVGWICAVYVVIFLVCLPVGVIEMANGNTVVVAAVAAFLGGLFWLKRYQANSRDVATMLGLPDRILFTQVVEAPRGEVKSRARAALGMYVHPVLIATDRHLVLARAASEAAGKAIAQEFEPAWEIAYSEITSFSSRNTGGESPDEVVSIHARERDLEYKMPAADGKAFVAILKHRAPGAFAGQSNGRRHARNGGDSPAESAVPTIEVNAAG
jgi:hypothetical protein